MASCSNVSSSLIDYSQEQTNSQHNELNNSDSTDDDLVDFGYYDSTDRIYREYDPPSFQCVSASWKVGRPTYLKSWLRCIQYSFVLTVPCGAGIAAVAIMIVWLHLNLGAMCRNFTDKDTWYKMPIGIQNAILTKDVVECMVIQCWHLLIILPIFGWRLVKKLNLLLWTMFVASTDAVYRLLLNVYHTYSQIWSPFPMILLFALSLVLISYKVASQYRQNIRQRLQLAFKLGAQFYLGFPVALTMDYVMTHYFEIISKHSKAILASLSPALVIIPKAIGRLCAEKMEGLNHPGTSILLLISLYAAPPMFFRILQAKLHGFWMYFALSIVHGIEGTFDKVTLPLQDYILRRCCSKRRRGYVSKQRKPRVNRFLADLSIISFLAESSAIFVSSFVIQMCRYYYGHDDKGRAYEALTIFEAGCWQVITGIIVELLFSAIAMKIQTYYYNIPIIRVWKKRKLWLIAMFLIHMVISMFYFGDHFYHTFRTNEMFDKRITHKCTEPFRLP